MVRVATSVTSSIRQTLKGAEKTEGTPVEFIEITPVQKKIALKVVCQDKYTENDLIYMRISSNLTKGWAFTKDSFCYGGPDGTGIIPYKDIKSLYQGNFFLDISINKKNAHNSRIYSEQLLQKKDELLIKKIVDYLGVAKNI